MKRTTVLLVVLALALVGVWYWRKGTVVAGKPTIKPSSKGLLVDPCPGDSQIWDADLNKCIEFDSSDTTVPVSASVNYQLRKLVG